MAGEPWDDLCDKLDAHIVRFDELADNLALGNIMLANGKTAAVMIEEHDLIMAGHNLLLDEVVGEADPLTKIRSGGIRGDVGELKGAMYKLEHQAANGGINAKLKVTFWQKVAIATLPFATAGAFAILQALIERL